MWQKLYDKWILSIWCVNKDSDLEYWPAFINTKASEIFKTILLLSIDSIKNEAYYVPLRTILHMSLLKRG